MTDLGTRARSAAGNRNTIVVAALIVLALIYPSIVSSLQSLPVIGDFVPATDSMVVMIVFTTMAIGLNMVVGYAGLLDLGYVAFYAVGAYTAGWFASEQFSQVSINIGAVGLPAGLPGIHISMWLILPLAGLLTLFAGIVIGLPTLRLRGDYLAIVTLGFGEIVRIIITNNAFGITNGAAGLPAAGQFIPKPFGLQWLIDNVYFKIPALGKSFIFTIDGNVYWYYMIVLLCLLTIFVVRRLDQSRLGRSWAAMREDEVAASSVGVSITAAKLWAFSLGALWGGIAGLTFANFQQFVSPESFTFMESVFIVCTIVIGGMGSIPGAIVGAIIIQGIPAFIQGMAAAGKLPGVDPSTATVIANYRFLVFGLFVVIMMAWRPQGLIPSKRRAAELQPETAEMGDIEGESLYDAQHDVGHPGIDE